MTVDESLKTSPYCWAVVVNVPIVAVASIA